MSSAVKRNAPGARRIGRGKHERQPRQRRGETQRPATRRERPRDADCRRSQRERVRAAAGARASMRGRTEPGERVAHDGEQAVRGAIGEGVERRGQQDGREHRRRDEQADPRNREGIRERADQRDLRKPVGGERREADRHRVLDAAARCEVAVESSGFAVEDGAEAVYGFWHWLTHANGANRRAPGPREARRQRRASRATSTRAARTPPSQTGSPRPRRTTARIPAAVTAQGSASKHQRQAPTPAPATTRSVAR